MEKKRGREGFELILGPGAINGWRGKEFPSDQKELELEIARIFCSAIDDDLAAQRSDNEPFDVEVFSKSRHNLIAGVQLVDAYDDARRRRDADRRQLSGWCGQAIWANAGQGGSPSNRACPPASALQRQISTSSMTAQR